MTDQTSMTSSEAEVPAWLAARRAKNRETMRRLREQRKKPPPNHTCPPSAVDQEYRRLMTMLDSFASGNIAHIPVAIALETYDGEPTWAVDLHIHIPHKCEYEVEGRGETLADALANACRRFAHQKDLARISAKDAKDFNLNY